MRYVTPEARMMRLASQQFLMLSGNMDNPGEDKEIDFNDIMKGSEDLV